MALLIDLSILACLYVGCFLTTGLALFQTALGNFPASLAGLAIYLLLLLLSPPLLAMAYFLAFHGLLGQTIGKLCLGLRVVDREGGPISMGAAFLRLVGYLVSGLPLAAGFLWAAVDREGLAWHDRLAGTVVVEDSQPNSQPETT